MNELGLKPPLPLHYLFLEPITPDELIVLPPLPKTRRSKKRRVRSYFLAPLHRQISLL
jgi:hypothetical protein